MLEYKKYIESDEWYEKSAQFLKNNPLCEFCGIEEATQTHHKSYERIGKEEDDDLMATCETCHRHIHRRPVTLKSYDNTKKAMYILNNLLNRKQRALRLFVLNDLSRDFYNYKMMLDVVMEKYPKTPLFEQALIYMLEEDSEKYGEDLIEYVWKTIYNYKMKLGKKRKSFYDKNLTQKYTSPNRDLFHLKYKGYNDPEEIPDEVVLERNMIEYIKRVFIVFKQEDDILQQAKKKDPSINKQTNYQIWASKLNIKFYGNKYWNQERMKDLPRFRDDDGKWDFFIKVLKEDGYLTELYLMLGGDGDILNGKR